MDFIGGINLREIGNAMVNEGFGTAGGFIGGGILGRQGENLIMGKDPVTQAQIEVLTTDTFTTKAKAYLGNNVPKVAVWYIMRRYDAGSEVTKDVSKSLMGSVAFDTLLRLANNGVNPAAVYLGDYRILSGQAPAGGANVQKLSQENAILKAELNKAIRQLGAGASGAGGQIKVQEVPYAPTPPPWPLTERSQRGQSYGFMPGDGAQAAQQIDPRTAIRQRSYGFAGEHQSASENIAKMFGML